jgi:hypothetical protein
MGLIKAALGAAGGTLADQWKEFFYCDAIDNDVLAVKGQKRTSFLQYQGKRQHYHHRIRNRSRRRTVYDDRRAGQDR